MPKYNLPNVGKVRMKRGSMGPNGGPIRRKKEPNIIQSILGVFIGILLILGSPIVMWMAESQDRAEEYGTAERVEAMSSASGYVVFSGEASYYEPTGGADCHREGCVYQHESMEELVTVEELKCGTVQESETVRVIRENGYECDEDGNCKTCYDIERDEWQVQSELVTTYPFTVGGYNVYPSESAIYFDTSEDIVDRGFSEATLNDLRTVYTSFVPVGQTLVAGQASNGDVRAPEKEVYVISNFDDATTMAKLEEIDRQNTLFLRVATFVMILFGFLLILGPLQWAGRQLRFIPVVGPMLKQASGFMILIAALVLSVPIWIVLFLLVTVLKTWWLALIVALALLVGGVWLYKKKAKQG